MAIDGVRSAHHEMTERSEHSRLGANLELDAIRGPGSIIYGLTTGLNVTRDTVIVARGVLLELVCREEGNSVFGCAESSRRGVVGQGAGGDVVRGLGTKDETVIAHDSVGGDLGALDIGEKNVSFCIIDWKRNKTARTLRRSTLARLCKPGNL